jgi:hypothetical protein
MSTQLSHQRSRHWMATWTAGPRLGRLATVLAAVVAGLLASAAAATAAFANSIPIGDGGAVPVVPVPPATVRPAGQHRWHGGLADRPGRSRGRSGRRGRGRVPGPQAGWPPSGHRYHRLMRPSATTHRACLTTGPRAGTVRQARVWPPARPGEPRPARECRPVIALARLSAGPRSWVFWRRAGARESCHGPVDMPGPSLTVAVVHARQVRPVAAPYGAAATGRAD